MRFLLTILGLLVVLGWHSSSDAVPVMTEASAAIDYRAIVGDHPSSIALARGLDARLLLRRGRRGEVMHVQHCRQSQGGCRARIAAMARLITDSSNEFGFDPFLTAGVAMRESGLNPLAVSPVGAVGIVQLHPKYRGKTVPFVYNERYRAECARQPGGCQREVLDAGLGLLAWAIERCDGDVQKGLGWYNSGHCQSNRYARSVLRERRRLLRQAKGIEPGQQTVFLD